MNRWLPLALLLCSSPAWAHSPLSGDAGLPVWLAALLLFVLWALYLSGCRRVAPGGVSLTLFHVTLLITALTLFGPLDDLAETSASAHMVQHMLMMVVIAPLAVLARPLPQYQAAFGGSRHLLRPLLRGARFPMAMALLHALMVWGWHVPVLYRWALHNEWVHVLEHACFLISAGLFWWAVLRSSLRGTPAALVALLFTLMQTGFLGALLTFSDRSFYGDARSVADQQLAGLLMWVMGGLPYLAASAWCGWRWWQRVGRRTTGASGQ